MNSIPAKDGYAPIHAFPTGMIRSDRHAPDPSASEIRIEDDSLSRFLYQVAGHSRQLRFWDDSGAESKATWAVFFENSVLFVLSEMIHTDSDALEQTRARALVDFGNATTVFGREEAILELLDQVLHLGTRGLSWEESLARPEIAQSFPEVHDLLVQRVRNLLDPRLQDILDFFRQLVRFCRSPIWQSTRLPGDRESASTRIQEGFRKINLPDRDGRRTEDMPRDYNGFAEWLSEVSLTLIQANSELRQLAAVLLQKSINTPSHPPHIALLVAFHAMLQKALVHLNRAGERHLDFYYRRVLGLIPRSPVPDRAWVVFRAAPSAGPAVVEAGTALVAGKGPKGQPIRYSLRKTTSVYPVQIDAYAAIRCLRPRGSNPSSGGVFNTRAEPTIDNAAALLARSEATRDSHGSNPNASIPTPPGISTRLGFAISAPVLAVSDAKRTIRIRLYLHGPEIQAQAQPETQGLTNPGEPQLPAAVDGVSAAKETPQALGPQTLVETIRRMEADSSIDLKEWVGLLDRVIAAETPKGAPGVIVNRSTPDASADKPVASLQGIETPISPTPTPNPNLISGSPAFNQVGSSSPGQDQGIPSEVLAVPRKTIEVLLHRRRVVETIVREITAQPLVKSLDLTNLADEPLGKLPTLSLPKGNSSFLSRITSWSKGSGSGAPQETSSLGTHYRQLVANLLQIAANIRAAAEGPLLIERLLHNLDESGGQSLMIGPLDLLTFHKTVRALDAESVVIDQPDPDPDPDPVMPGQSEILQAVLALAAKPLRFQNQATALGLLQSLDPRAQGEEQENRPPSNPTTSLHPSAPSPGPKPKPLDQLRADMERANRLRIAVDYQFRRAMNLIQNQIAAAEESLVSAPVQSTLAKIRETPQIKDATDLETNDPVASEFRSAVAFLETAVIGFPSSAKDSILRLQSRINRLQTEAEGGANASQRAFHAIAKLSSRRRTSRQGTPRKPSATRPPTPNAEIHRVVKSLRLRIQASPKIPTLSELAQLFQSSHQMAYSGPEGWVENIQFKAQGFLEQGEAESSTPSECPVSGLELYVEIPPKFPPISPCIGAIHGPGITTEAPALRFLSNGDAGVSDELLSKCEVRRIRIDVEVDGTKRFNARTSSSAVDVNAPFSVFAPPAARGTEFFIGSPEIFAKKPSFLSLEIDWAEVPMGANGFRDHYMGYPIAGNSSRWSNPSFRASIDALHEGRWMAAITDTSHGQAFNPRLARSPHAVPIFDWTPNLTDSLDGPVKQKSWFVVSGFERNEGDAGGWNLPFPIQPPPNSSRSHSWLRVTLTHPLDGFGHDLFQEALSTHGTTSAALLLAAAAAAAKAAKESPEKPLEPPALRSLSPPPKPPFVPKAKELRLSYAAFEDSADSLRGNRTIGFHLIEPFSVFNLPFPPSDSHPPPMAGRLLRPPLEFEGALFLGLKCQTLPTSFSFLFIVREGSQPQASTRATTEIHWSIRTQDGWLQIPPQDVRDGTGGLANSGIMTLRLPGEEKVQQQSFANRTDLCWLALWVISGSERTNAIVSVLPNPAEVLYSDGADPEVHFEQPLPAKSISKAERSIPGIVEILQPVASFGGRPAESTPTFRTRAREWIRHKGRAVTPWDFECLVLDQFPSLQAVRAIPGMDEQNRHVPSTITLSVMPRPSANGIEWTPGVDGSLLKEIQDFVSSRSDPFLQVVVRNPSYVRVRIRATLRLEEGYAIGVLRPGLESTLNASIAPWAAGVPTSNPYRPTWTKESIRQLLRGHPHVNDIQSLHFELEYGANCEDQVTQVCEDAPLPIPRLFEVFTAHGTHDFTETTDFGIHQDKSADKAESPKAPPISIASRVIDFPGEDLPGYCPNADTLHISGFTLPEDLIESRDTIKGERRVFP